MLREKLGPYILSMTENQARNERGRLLRLLVADVGKLNIPQMPRSSPSLLRKYASCISQGNKNVPTWQLTGGPRAILHHRSVAGISTTESPWHVCSSSQWLFCELAWIPGRPLKAERRKIWGDVSRLLDLWRDMFCPPHIYQFSSQVQKKGDSEDLCAPYCLAEGIVTVCKEAIILPFTTSRFIFFIFLFFWLPLPFSKCFCKVTVKQ